MITLSDVDLTAYYEAIADDVADISYYVRDMYILSYVILAVLLIIGFFIFVKRK